jgi:hypothetical protein
MVEDNQPTKPEFEVKLEEMRAENARMEKNISELKQLKAIDALGGGTNAGQPPQQKPIESDHDYRLRIEREIREGKKEFS